MLSVDTIPVQRGIVCVKWARSPRCVHCLYRTGGTVPIVVSVVHLLAPRLDYSYLVGYTILVFIILILSSTVVVQYYSSRVCAYITMTISTDNSHIYMRIGSECMQYIMPSSQQCIIQQAVVLS